MNFFIEQVKDLCMILWRYSSEEVYDGPLADIFVWLCVQLFLCVGLYENVDVEYLHEAVFCSMLCNLCTR